ncbi:MAG TPA: hypothetical protein VFF52_15165 [Isosphaeraceae bacterium]|nr:hypothetical protein [Isosphaeraceae bacterium]
MSDKELARALLRLGATEEPEAPSPKEQIRRILARDRHLVKLLTALTVFLWLGSVVVLYYFMFEVVGLYARVEQVGGAGNDPFVKPVYQFLLALASSVEALSLAFLSSMILLFVTRRASLRQINAGLLDLTEKLDRLEESLAKERSR